MWGEVAGILREMVSYASAHVASSSSTSDSSTGSRFSMTWSRRTQSAVKMQTSPFSSVSAEKYSGTGNCVSATAVFVSRKIAWQVQTAHHHTFAGSLVHHAGFDTPPSASVRSIGFRQFRAHVKVLARSQIHRPLGPIISADAAGPDVIFIKFFRVWHQKFVARPRMRLRI